MQRPIDSTRVSRAQAAGRQLGFTLVEIIVAILIMSILAIGLTSFITDSAEGFVQAANRNQVSAAGRMVLDRISMELHNALPNSVRISTVRTVTNVDGFAGDQCLEFVPVRAATTYIDPAIRPAARKTIFSVVNLEPTQIGATTDIFAVIFPNSTAELYAASFTAPTTAAIVKITSVADSVPTDGKQEITTGSHRFLRSSPVERLFVTDSPVSFCVVHSKLYRYSGYGFKATQLLPHRPNGTCAAAECLPNNTGNISNEAKRWLITDQLDNTLLTGASNSQAFDQVAASRQRNAVIQLDLNFSQGGEVVRLNHEVLMQTTP